MVPAAPPAGGFRGVAELWGGEPGGEGEAWPTLWGLCEGVGIYRLAVVVVGSPRPVLLHQAAPWHGQPVPCVQAVFTWLSSSPSSCPHHFRQLLRGAVCPPLRAALAAISSPSIAFPQGSVLSVILTAGS